MKRKVSNLDFGLVWGKVSRWPDKEWADLVELRASLDAARAEAPARKVRRPKAAKPEGGAA